MSRVIIVGAGPSGIAAASRLIQNGFDVTIFEAENRIGGRICSFQMGEYTADLGAEWVHGEKDNVAFELAWPLGLLERAYENKEFNSSGIFVGSDGEIISEQVAAPLLKLLENISDTVGDVVGTLKTGSVGEYAEIKINEYFKSHPEISADKHKPLMESLNSAQMTMDGAKNWHEVSAKGFKDYADCEGDQLINWKHRTYSTILDILMKKYPNPKEELPIRSKTKLNSKISRIDYSKSPIKVTTINGENFFADHIIVTPSIAVLQKNHETLFTPALTGKKLNAIMNLALGRIAKILVYYENPWWIGEPFWFRHLYWTSEDKKEIENDPQRRWMLGLTSSMRIEHRPKMMVFWVTGCYVHEMESIDEKLFQEQVKQVINKFFGKTHKLSEPKIIKRSLWNTNENFLGTQSFRPVKADLVDAHIEDYAAPIEVNNKPTILFAGEATSLHYSTVHGAIESGWREADRLINYYK
ncbi:GSCOCG00007476001-RA-CDS [Cotesia congregata]|uniref:Similar to Smox: Spermine oxidase (Mus musculus) n=1 Tax=Cotesia congregata TaxID=51543 RepID=A0A8J2H502_COTCN|nr:GSCOCG00007476001-RA-CDS [Cotesia congregata]CAG5073616.1 Similar to Smox: Spermine oxidase (Mus musculus) [Cotesia congregata]